ncbi:MAG TPA: alkaline phosphatase D family protein [Beijerinckiaceae bacterium]|jgi:alkaline phosphatase D
MAVLRPPGLGPIIGATTDTTCRVWIRAGDPADAGAILNSNRRTIGIIGLVGRNNRIGDAWYFRLQREYDRTGTFRLGADVDLGRHTLDIAAKKRAQPGKRVEKAAEPSPLAPDMEYTVRLGTLTIDDPMPDEENLPDWQLRDRLPDIDALKGELLRFTPAESEATFRTFPAAGKALDRLVFFLGSCRYPGLLWKVKEADRIFGPMVDQLTQEPDDAARARFTLMVGDQIYADALNKSIPILRADTYEEFQERYTTAFGAPNLRRLLKSAPAYMILDDHEIEDNWTQDRLRDEGKHVLFNIAISAYMSYQWSHGPRTWGQLLYYTFDCGNYPFFVLDTRTQRFKDDSEGLRDNHMLGRPTIDPQHPGQLQRLVDWLSEQQKTQGDVPKFIVTSSVFVPNAIDERLDPFEPPPVDARFPMAPWPTGVESAVFDINRKRREGSDSWPAYPNTRTAVLRRIVEEKIQNVVFLAGDIHCSNVAEIEFEGEGLNDLKAFAVTSSAFYWPFPFADGDPNGYVHDSRAPGQTDPFPILGTHATMHYRAFGFTQKDNFCRLEADRQTASLTVRVFDRDGVPVKTADAKGKETSANVLKLAPWK